jgi:hypothetical protein
MRDGLMRSFLPGHPQEQQSWDFLKDAVKKGYCSLQEEQVKSYLFRAARHSQNISTPSSIGSESNSPVNALISTIFLPLICQIGM